MPAARPRAARPSLGEAAGRARAGGGRRSCLTSGAPASARPRPAAGNASCGASGNVVLDPVASRGPSGTVVRSRLPRRRQRLSRRLAKCSSRPLVPIAAGHFHALHVGKCSPLRVPGPPFYETPLWGLGGVRLGRGGALARARGPVVPETARFCRNDLRSRDDSEVICGRERGSSGSPRR
jgi:hypothetical protein